jgi:alkylation response protein AidB-like acyl-CoA dehydrogenase
VAILKRVAKTFISGNIVERTGLGMQVLGGHGDLHECGLKQSMHDVRISIMYEGSNGVQALDFLGRKILLGQEAKLRQLSKSLDSGEHRFLFTIIFTLRRRKP